MTRMTGCITRSASLLQVLNKREQLESGAALQRGFGCRNGLDRNLMKFNRGRGKALHPGWSSSMQQHKLGDN